MKSGKGMVHLTWGTATAAGLLAVGTPVAYSVAGRRAGFAIIVAAVLLLGTLVAGFVYATSTVLGSLRQGGQPSPRPSSSQAEDRKRALGPLARALLGAVGAGVLVG